MRTGRKTRFRVPLAASFCKRQVPSKMYAVIETGGTPYVSGASVRAKVIKNGKAKKITVMTYKPKKGEKKKQGHRQPYTQVQIEAIEA